VRCCQNPRPSRFPYLFGGVHIDSEVSNFFENPRSSSEAARWEELGARTATRMCRHRCVWGRAVHWCAGQRGGLSWRQWFRRRVLCGSGGTRRRGSGTEAGMAWRRQSAHACAQALPSDGCSRAHTLTCTRTRTVGAHLACAHHRRARTHHRGHARGRAGERRLSHALLTLASARALARCRV